MLMLFSLRIINKREVGGVSLTDRQFLYSCQLDVCGAAALHNNTKLNVVISSSKILVHFSGGDN